MTPNKTGIAAASMMAVAAALEGPIDPSLMWPERLPRDFTYFHSKARGAAKRRAKKRAQSAARRAGRKQRRGK